MAVNQKWSLAYSLLMDGENGAKCRTKPSWNARPLKDGENGAKCRMKPPWNARPLKDGENVAKCRMKPSWNARPPEGWGERSKVSDEAIPRQSERTTVRTEHFVHDKESKYLTI
ncbi:hypothetical protein [Paenibacillus sp. OSY-SE]|uniref:hypothetical protein n=1 Tax=Paenibacillus sp. OSY-SE TaxID=1196323 RepID=UPI000361DC26|nr:hypothetical protein [Paenibacillus sp. OSY-SE]